MASRRIPTPWGLRLKRWRETFLPPIALLAAAAATLWLWRDHAGITGEVGEVLAVRYELAARVDGQLIDVGPRSLEPFDQVAAGQLVARLDPRATLARLETLRAQMAVTRNELTAAAVELQIDRADRLREQAIDRQRLLLSVKGLRLDVLDRRSAIEADRVEEQRLTERVDQLQQLVAERAETDFSLLEARLQRDVVRTRRQENERAQAAASEELEEAEAELALLPEVAPDDLEARLAPFRAALDVHEAELNELKLAIESLELRAPDTGMITHVHRRPGETARAGEPIVTLARPESDRVVSYVRERNPLSVEVGERVTLRQFSRVRDRVHATILELGAQVELVPEHQRRDPQVPEWGRPVLIQLPEGHGLTPGELLSVEY